MARQLDIGQYGQSEHGNFAVVDTIPVPHPYTIGAKHVAHASDRFSGMLGEAAIESAERHGIKCQHRGCTLKWKQHETALLVDCKADLKDGDRVNPELQAYLLKCKEQAEADGFAGFAFRRAE